MAFRHFGLILFIFVPMKRYPLTLAFLGMWLCVCMAGAEQGQQFKNMHEAMEALKTAKNPAEADKIRAGLGKIPITTREDLAVLYDEAHKQEEAMPLVAEDKTYDEHVSHGAALVSRLKTVTDPTFHGDIASLIDKEYQDTRREARLTLPKLTTRSHMKAAMRYERINALMTAAGDGKNEKARTALWEIIEIAQDDNLGKGAAIALGKIGNPEDLDRLISMVKHDPKLLFPLENFGPMLISRVMREVDDPSAPMKIKARFAGYLEEVGSHDAISMLMPLLEHSNDDVVRHAAGALERALRPGDDQAIHEMLKSPKWNVRVCAIIAIGQQAWRDDYGPLLINVLQSDQDFNNRALAAHYLGEHRVQGAEPAVRDALKDKSGSVRTDAASALKKISGQK